MSNKKIILVSDPISENGLNILNNASYDVHVITDHSKPEFMESVQKASGWIIRSGTKITKEYFSQAANLEIIGRAGVGVDNIDIPEATRKGVLVMNTPDVNTISAAEHTVGLILSLARNIAPGHMGLINGEWNRHKLVGTELRGKTLGVVGLGKIGREVISRCRPFGMKIIGFDPYIPAELFNSDEITVTDLDTVTRESDFLTLHVPLVDGTRNLFDYQRLSMMKSNSRIINVARGGIINEDDLAQALNENLIGGAAIDVYLKEPIDGTHPLVKCDNCLLTPHLGASTSEAKEGVSIAITEQMRDFLENGTMNNVLNMPISDSSKLKELEPWLKLAEIMGSLHDQLSFEPVQTIKMICFGEQQLESKPILLALVKGLLKGRTPDRVNFINAETLALERGILLEEKISSEKHSFSTMIRSVVETKNQTYQIDGCVFGDGRPRIVNINGYEMELKPRGCMLFILNKDVPGVVGKVGTILGKYQVNIGSYLLNRKSNEVEAFSILHLEPGIEEAVMDELRNMDEIIDVKSCLID